MAENEDPQGTQGRLPRALKVIAGGVTFLLAVLGAYTGTTVWLEDRKVVVHLSAQPFIGPQLMEGLIRFSIINQSRHAVAIESGDVLLNGRMIGAFSDVLTDLRRVDSFAQVSPELRQRAQSLPVEWTQKQRRRLRQYGIHRLRALSSTP